AALLGDANLDGAVGTPDLAILAGAFGQSGQTWATADFSGNGTVDTADLAILAGNFGAEVSLVSTSVAGAAVPEPGSLLAAIGLGGLALFTRRDSAVRIV
ncbi:MAG: dockerin type I domain-containing protein, partial [Planctomycetota bacterium]